MYNVSLVLLVTWSYGSGFKRILGDVWVGTEGSCAFVLKRRPGMIPWTPRPHIAPVVYMRLVLFRLSLWSCRRKSINHFNECLPGQSGRITGTFHDWRV